MNTELRNKLFNKIKNVFETRTLKNERHFFKQEKMLIDNTNMHIDLQLMLLKGLIHQKMLQY